ncbi:MAG: glycosyltransferase family 4 protein [Candidatus Promineifilaceae bacterium]|nr:glycosyltransferase family 4 protein [Candidatus Promineifilaceae bacterium]
MTLKIGLVTGEFPPMEGGVGAFTQELARELNDQGHEVHIITARQARPAKRHQSLWDLDEPYELEYGLLHPRVRRWWWGAVNVVADVSVRHKLDVVNVQYQAAAFDMHVPAINLLPWRLRTVANSVVTFHDLRVPYLFPKAGKWRSRTVGHLARASDGVIVTNRADEQALLRRGVSGARMERIPIGSNIKPVARDEAMISALRDRLGLKDSDCLVGYFGFVNESKGADLLVRAAAALPRRVHLAFIGGQTGSSDPSNNEVFLQRLEALILELGLGNRVHWSGFIPEQDVSTYLYACDLMAMPYRDGASLRRGTLMAILAHGRPLVTTTPGQDVVELEHGRNLWFVPVEVPSALGEAIESLLADQALRQSIGRQAGYLARAFAWPTIAAQTAEFYQRIAGNP